eukprot:UN03413
MAILNTKFKSLSLVRHCFVLNAWFLFCNLLWTSHHLYGLDRNNLDAQTNANIITLTQPFRPLLVTITTFGFVDFTKNWVISLQKNGINDSLVLCGDIKCYQSIKQFSSNINVELISDSILPEHGRFARFDSQLYKKIVNERSAIMHTLFMKLYKYNNSQYDGVLFMDSDIAVTNNFLPLLQNEYLYFDKSKAIINDMVVVKDVNDFECNKTSDGPYCGCLLFL